MGEWTNPLEDMLDRANDDVPDPDSYLDESGRIRSHRAALAAFDEAVLDARQAHRQWAEPLELQFRTLGMREFLQRRWKSLGAGLTVVDSAGKRHDRDSVRGAQIVTAEGAVEWTSTQLALWGEEELKQAIAIAVSHVTEERVNIGMYRKCLDAIEETGAVTVAAAMDALGTTLEEFLATDEQALMTARDCTWFVIGGCAAIVFFFVGVALAHLAGVVVVKTLAIVAAWFALAYAVMWIVLESPWTEGEDHSDPHDDGSCITQADLDALLDRYHRPD